MPIPHMANLKGSFLDLSRSEQDEMFALSCFDEAHWEDAPSWEIDRDQINQNIDKYLKRLFGGHWRAITRNGNLRTIRSRFHHGEMTNEILSWYLEHTTDYYCRTESRSPDREFDLQLMADGFTVCDIGIKRLATTNQVRDYLREHRSKHDDIGETDANMLLNFYPTTNAVTSSRVGDFVIGYGYVSEDTHPFYSRDTTFVANIPAPISYETNDQSPLEEVKNILNHWLGDLR